MTSTSGTLGVPFSLGCEAPHLPDLGDFWQHARKLGVVASLRAERSCSEALGFSSAVLDPMFLSQDEGAMVTAWLADGSGYAASSRFDLPSLLRALEVAAARARIVAASGLFRGLSWPNPKIQDNAQALWRAGGGLASDSRSLQTGSLNEALPDRRQLIGMLRDESDAAHAQAGVIGSEFKLRLQVRTQTLWFDGQCLAIRKLQFVEPHAQVTVAAGRDAQTRSLAGRYNGYCQQGGAEVIERSGLRGCGNRLADEARQLVLADNCPAGRTRLLLMPDQMMLQIHESIGHPLELDRILGDERNFAGTSFVGMDMFGHYQYGSPLLNVSFDPASHPEELGSYERDDEGFPATKTMLIEEGILKRPLGSALSVQRAAALGHELEGVANARSVGWHRASIDRMANLNVEPGQSSLEQMIGDIDQGVLMRTNVSWSIDDSRNKFQFGCEWGELIRHGKLAGVVKNPGYRGISANFWRSLVAVGDESTYAVMGTPFCGKGEPGQVIRVGHAAPACVFSDVDVFGAAS